MATRPVLRAGDLAGRLLGERSGSRGSLLAAMLVMTTISSIMLAMASTEWSFVMKREREQELIYRGVSIIRAIDEWQSGGQAPPTTLELMTKPPRPTLRRIYPDPVTARFDDEGELVEGTGEWVLITPQSEAEAALTTDASGPRTSAPEARRGSAPQLLPIVGVKSRSEDLSIGKYQGDGPEAKYSDWKFRILGGMGAQLQQTGGGYETPRPPGFGGVRRPGGPPVTGTRGLPPAGSGATPPRR